MEKLMLSADGDIMLYEAEEQILYNFEDLIEQFDKWKKTNCFDEKLFVNFIKQIYGNESIIFIKNLGWFNEKHIPKEYEDVKWLNF